jgi:hypothetical protein
MWQLNGQTANSGHADSMELELWNQLSRRRREEAEPEDAASSAAAGPSGPRPCRVCCRRILRERIG